MNKRSIFGVLLFLATCRLQAECIDEGEWRSSSILSAMLADNPALQVNSESSELTLRGGSIYLSSEASIQSAVSGPVTMTGDAVIKARGRYRLIQRGARTFIRITSVRADQAVYRLFINGELATEQNFKSQFFADRMMRYRCTSGRLRIFQEVDGTSRTLDFGH